MALNPYLVDWKRAIDVIGGRPVVFTNGCFDVFHSGHVHLLRTCKTLTDLTGSVVVGLNSDRSVRRLKGKGRPLVGLEDRRMVLRACRYVDMIIPFDEETPEELIRLIQPDVLVKDASYEGKFIAGKDFVESIGGKVVLVEPVAGISTTKIVRRVMLGKGIKVKLDDRPRTKETEEEKTKRLANATEARRKRSKACQKKAQSKKNPRQSKKSPKTPSRKSGERSA